MLVQTVRNLDRTFLISKAPTGNSYYKIFSATNQAFTRNTSGWKITIFAFLLSTVIGLSTTGIISFKLRSSIFKEMFLKNMKNKRTIIQKAI